jgi:hypothetical protein
METTVGRHISAAPAAQNDDDLLCGCQTGDIYKPILLSIFHVARHAISECSRLGTKLSIGPFHRRESPTQTAADAIMQCNSSEIWGRTPRGGNWPTVQAYAGPIRTQRGVQFYTDITPHPNGSPLEIRWYLGVTPGVESRVESGEVFACISAAVENFQR